MCCQCAKSNIVKVLNVSLSVSCRHVEGIVLCLSLFIRKEPDAGE